MRAWRLKMHGESTKLSGLSSFSRKLERQARGYRYASFSDKAMRMQPVNDVFMDTIGFIMGREKWGLIIKLWWLRVVIETYMRRYSKWNLVNGYKNCDMDFIRNRGTKLVSLWNARHTNTCGFDSANFGGIQPTLYCIYYSKKRTYTHVWGTSCCLEFVHGR